MASLIDLFKGSPYDVVKKDTDTVLEQETTGIRVRSAVELNNPTFYGNEAIRIGTRSTPSVELMREATNGSAATGGALGLGISKISGGKFESVSELRNGINDFLGIPQAPLPTRIVNAVREGQSIQEAIDSTKGTEVGKFLKQTGGGTPNTIGKQALGNGIQLAKDKARKFLFGSPAGTGVNEPNNESGIVFGGEPDTLTYTEYSRDGLPELFNAGDATIGTAENLQELYAARFPGIDLSLYSPIYGVERGSKEVFNTIGAAGTDETGSLQKYTPTETYTGIATNEDDERLLDNSLQSKRGLFNDLDVINSTPFGQEIPEPFQDLIPFWIKRVTSGNSGRLNFRTLVTGINENVSPSWNSSKFLGNPFSYYTYSGVERGVSLNLLIYSMDEIELQYNWQKLNELTKLTYPTIRENNLTDPPIVQFRLGDIYNNRNAYIESLTYTIDDNSTWEINPLVGLLPKVIEVSLSFKIIEQPGDELSLYDYKKSTDAINIINERRGNNSFAEDPVTGGNNNSQQSSVDNTGRPATVTVNNNAPTPGPDGTTVTAPADTEGLNSGEPEIARVYKTRNSRVLRELNFWHPGKKSRLA